MTNFKLLQHSSNRAKTTFHVLNSAGDIIGSIKIPRGQESDFKNIGPGRGRRRQNPGVPAVKLPRLSKQALLRS